MAVRSVRSTSLVAKICSWAPVSLALLPSLAVAEPVNEATVTAPEPPKAEALRVEAWVSKRTLRSAVTAVRPSTSKPEPLLDNVALTF